MTTRSVSRPRGSASTSLQHAAGRRAPSVYPPDLDAPQTALSAIGQYDVRATALQMAMVGAGVANDGVVMKPYLVAEEQAPDLSITVGD